MKSQINQLRSKVMTAARIIWTNNKSLSWSEAVTKAWADMKSGRNVIAEELHGKTSCRVVTKTWVKDDKVRIYINLYFKDGSKIDLGYADAVSKKCYFSDKGYQAVWAARMERNLVFA